VYATVTQSGTAAKPTLPATQQTTTVDATCAAGYQVTGGGYSITDNVLGNLLTVKASQPSGTTIWRVIFLSADSSDHAVSVYALCQKFTP
jgi:hypothetical protein